MNDDPYGTRVDMMRTQLVNLPTDLLEKVFAYMRLDRSNSAAKRIQKVWRRISVYLKHGKVDFSEQLPPVYNARKLGPVNNRWIAYDDMHDFYKSGRDRRWSRRMRYFPGFQNW
jgi:hypothetical protein